MPEFDLGVGHEHVESRKDESGHDIRNGSDQELDETAKQLVALCACKYVRCQDRQTAQQDYCNGNQQQKREVVGDLAADLTGFLEAPDEIQVDFNAVGKETN